MFGNNTHMQSDINLRCKFNKDNIIIAAYTEQSKTSGMYIVDNSKISPNENIISSASLSKKFQILISKFKANVTIIRELQRNC